MNSTQKLPACCRHIDKAKASDILYTLAKYTSPKRIADTDTAGFHSLLCAAGIISPDCPLPQKRDEITCFQVISEYKCGYLCQMCDYSSRNKNQLEAEESILLAYAMKGWNHFDYLKKEGLSPEHFHAVFLLNDMPSGKTVSTLPLFRLSYSYIERMGSPALNFKDLPVMIASALDQNNPGKLLPRNIQTIMDYLRRLQAGCSSLKQEKVTGTLLRVLQPEQNAVTQAQETEKESLLHAPLEPEKIAPVSGECIDGLLNPMTPAKPKGKSHKKPQAAETEITSTTVTASTPADQTVETDESAEHCQNSSIHPPAPSKADSTTDNSKASPITEESLFLPARFSAQDVERTGYPFHIIEENSADLQYLEKFLLFNPLVGMEIVTDTENGTPMVLLCASNQFYYAATDGEQALDIFRTYFSKSSVRRQICMDSHKVSHFLQQNDICCQNVYSLRNAYRVLSEAKGRTGIKKPSEMIRELVSKDNLYSYSPYIFAMLHYVWMYEVLSAHELMLLRPQADRLRTLFFIDMFLGYSYELGDVVDTAKPLFELDEKLEYRFHYDSGLKMREGILAVSFIFSAKKQVQPLVTELLGCIARKGLHRIYGFRLLQFSPDSFMIAAPEEHYGLLCDTIANLSTFLAEKMDLVPLDIKEGTLKQ